MAALFNRLPKRFSRAALLKNFPRAASLRILERFSPPNERIEEVLFEKEEALLRDAEQREIASPESQAAMLSVREDLSGFFSSANGFGRITRINYIDGVRIYFGNGDVAHVRPSGNADELRIYAVADTSARADAIASGGVAEPDGILRRMEC